MLGNVCSVWHQRPAHVTSKTAFVKKFSQRVRTWQRRVKQFDEIW